ncbi:MAG: MBL fold metallo-hydrolase [Candidatus Zixiibacteriota bacterium]|nr:MAG: MBL fold metallo-hydrolase [candidate division Zixibacteria bacterium]
MTVYTDDHVILERFEVGPFLVNTYLLGCRRSGQAAVVDPGDEGERLLDRCRALGLEIRWIALTHGHVDHIAEVAALRQATGAPVIIHPLDAPMLTDPRHNLSAYLAEAVTAVPADRFFREEEPFTVGQVELKVLHTPGHSPGSVCLAHPAFALVGDVLFYDSVGRSDFPGGSHEELIRNIRQKLLPLGDEVRIFPGHGPDTTIGRERRVNPFLNDLTGY